MTLSENRKRIERVIKEFESLPYAIGPKGTQVWLREYKKYANLTGSYLQDDHFSWVRGVYEWSQLFAYYKLWYASRRLLSHHLFRSQDFIWENEEDPDRLIMKSFRFRIGVSSFL